jgi:hypothetical protein
MNSFVLYRVVGSVMTEGTWFRSEQLPTFFVEASSADNAISIARSILRKGSPESVCCSLSVIREHDRNDYAIFMGKVHIV